MSELQESVAAAVPVEIDGSTWWFSRLGIRDMAEMEAWAEARHWARTNERLAHMPESMQERLYERALQRAEDGSAYAEVMSTFDGVLEMSWRSLHKRHPELTRQQVGELIRVGDHQRIQQALDAANNGKDGQDDPPATSPTGEASPGETPVGS